MAENLEPDLHPEDTRALLAGARQGDPAAHARLWERFYGELRRLAAGHLRHRADSLEPTALVHEVFLRLSGRELRGEDRGQFFALASLAMRSVLVDAARRREVRPAGHKVSLEKLELPAFDARRLDALLSRLEAEAPELGRVAALRCFGLEVTEAAEALGVSEPTVKRRWRLARAWLARELGVAPAEKPAGEPA
jgi:RNA polymerase sigma factor (TIGR02999 family)